MTITTSTSSPSYSTDPVAAGVRALMAPASMRRADRTGEAQAAHAAPLDIDRLYPDLAPQAPSRTARARTSVRHVCEAFVDMLGGAPMPIR